MAGSDRSRRMPAFARDLEGRYGTRFEAVYDSRPTWRLERTDGPSADTVRQAADAGALLPLPELERTETAAMEAARCAGVAPEQLDSHHEPAQPAGAR
ncbi:hypothetical protein [Micromonospora aurantiaca (nom. illeg.)]|uniref:hypothetical protein n=1 Tax=Micromonospora aurantiaca (nom. illeg.) TaxID=47850 RepID=UPI0033E65DFC